MTLAAHAIPSRPELGQACRGARRPYQVVAGLGQAFGALNASRRQFHSSRHERPACTLLAQRAREFLPELVKPVKVVMEVVIEHFLVPVGLALVFVHDPMDPDDEACAILTVGAMHENAAARRDDILCLGKLADVGPDESVLEVVQQVFVAFGLDTEDVDVEADRFRIGVGRLAERGCWAARTG